MKGRGVGHDHGWEASIPSQLGSVSMWVMRPPHYSRDFYATMLCLEDEIFIPNLLIIYP